MRNFLILYLGGSYAASAVNYTLGKENFGLLGGSSALLMGLFLRAGIKSHPAAALTALMYYSFYYGDNVPVIGGLVSFGAAMIF